MLTARGRRNPKPKPKPNQMEQSDVYVLKPAAPQRPWELYRNMLPDVPQSSEFTLA